MSWVHVLSNAPFTEAERLVKYCLDSCSDVTAALYLLQIKGTKAHQLMLDCDIKTLRTHSNQFFPIVVIHVVIQGFRSVAQGCSPGRPGHQVKDRP